VTTKKRFSITKNSALKPERSCTKGRPDTLGGETRGKEPYFPNCRNERRRNKKKCDKLEEGKPIEKRRMKKYGR